MLRLFIIFIAFLTLAIGFSQEVHEFTLEKAIKRAMETNRDLQIAQLEKDRAGEKYWEALSTALPQIDGNLSLTHNYLLPFFYLPGADSSLRKITVGFPWQYSGALQLQQTLYNFGRVGAAIKIADFYEEATDNDYITSRDNVIEETYLAYNLVHLASIKIRVNSFNYEIATQNYELVKHRFDAGLVSEFELLQAKVNMENLAPDVIESESEYERAINNLKVVLFLPMKEELVLSDSLFILPERVSVMKDDMWKRTDYVAEQWRLQMYGKNRTIEYSYHLPSLDALLQYQYVGANLDLSRNKSSEGATFNLGVTMSIPIFTGFRTQAKYEQAVIDYNQADLRLAKMKDTMEMEYENSLLRLEAARKRLVASGTSRESAMKALDIARTQKRVGSITELDFQASQYAYETSEKNYYSSVFDFNKAYIDLLKSTGKLGQLFINN